ncbi:MAG: hypothetical protein EPN43_11120 [Jatrophihabitans sp.]|nr:MAG: hypothetical protein EPN43_11120 [Jatrophihabitans sp.]
MSNSPYAPMIIRPISPSEAAAQRQAMADEEARYRKAKADAEAVFRASEDAVLRPPDPWQATLTRIDRLERQVRALQDRLGEEA